MHKFSEFSKTLIMMIKIAEICGTLTICQSSPKHLNFNSLTPQNDSEVGIIILAFKNEETEREIFSHSVK